MSAFWLEPAPLVLASKSAIRAKMLGDVGLAPDVRAAAVDERAVEAMLSGDGRDPSSVAGALAAAKGLAVSSELPGRLVLGCDQTLSLGGERFTKPTSIAEGRSQLQQLAGKTHMLASGAALARDGVIVWSGVAEARLAMRPLSEDFLDAYFAEAGESVFESVGGYRFEGVGAHLFESVEGDFFTILGLPLAPVLGALRDLGAVVA